jgi:hypothetical protein
MCLVNIFLFYQGQTARNFSYFDFLFTNARRPPHRLVIDVGAGSAGSFRSTWDYVALLPL